MYKLYICIVGICYTYELKYKWKPFAKSQIKQFWRSANAIQGKLVKPLGKPTK